VEFTDPLAFDPTIKKLTNFTWGRVS